MYHVNPLVEFGVIGRTGGISRELNALSDAQLYDLGIERPMIHEIAEALARKAKVAVRRGLVGRGMSMGSLFRAYSGA